MSPTTLAEGNFLVPNATFIAELVAFLLILWVLRRYVVPPVQKAMRERQEIIRRQLEEARETRERLESAEQDYQRVLAEARTEAAKIRDAARADGQRILDELKAQAQQEADRIRQRGEEQLATQRQQVISELRAEIGRLALTLASRMVGESLEDDERRRRTVDRFLDELDELAGDVPAAGKA
ncbi:MAG TPA: F0F1 ATP synthase subunit B [Mycobacteriales bacterium]|nr:F0F1 ATP synthase subunit B [Mycobacteriales bacterium]